MAEATQAPTLSTQASGLASGAAHSIAGDAVLEVSGLGVAFKSETGRIQVVHDVSFTLKRGEVLALVGESGSGKSVTSLALMQLTPPAPRTRLNGSALFRGRDGVVRDLLVLPETEMQAMRGNEISMIFQEPMTSLNPVQTVGMQIAEAMIFHRGLKRREALGEAQGLLERVGIPEARRRLYAYPHQLSGGMRQRIMIAMALACNPSVLIADEPTTALDVTVQKEILELLGKLRRELALGLLFISHDLGVVAQVADRVVVMYAGRVVEQGPAEEVLEAPRHPYTQGLLAATPRLERGKPTPIPGSVPQLRALPPGCAFEPRCGLRRSECGRGVPELRRVSPQHAARCVLV